MATKAEPSELQGHMTLMEHIAELRTRLVRSVIAVAIGAVIAWFLVRPAAALPARPAATALAGRGPRQPAPHHRPARAVRGPHQDHDLRRDHAGHAGDPLADLAASSRPASTRTRRSTPGWFVACGTALFFLGAAIAFWTVPKALEFLETIGGEENFNQFYAPGKYLRLITYMMLAFGIGFEFPILLVFLQIAGIVTRGAAPPVPPLRHRRPVPSSSPSPPRAPTRSACWRCSSR